MIIETKISKGFQIAVPAEVRKKFPIKENYILYWDVKEDHIHLTFREKSKFEEIIGIVKLDFTTDAVKIKNNHSIND